MMKPMSGSVDTTEEMMSTSSYVKKTTTKEVYTYSSKAEVGGDWGKCFGYLSAGKWNGGRGANSRHRDVPRSCARVFCRRGDGVAPVGACVSRVSKGAGGGAAAFLVLLQNVND